jgi:magnesium transporter
MGKGADRMITEQQEKLIQLLDAGETQNLSAVLDELHPIDVAACLEEVNDDDLRRFCAAVDTEYLSDILEEGEEELQLRILNALDDTSIIHLFSLMSKDDITDILGNQPIGMRKRLLKMMRIKDSRELQILLGYDEDSAGGIMTTEYVAIHEELNMEQALRKIKEIAPKTEVIDTIFVLNRHRQLVGTADLRDILVTPDEEKLSTIMDDHVVSVYPEEDQEEVSRLVSRYDLSVIPVIDRRDTLLGIITVDDIIDVLVEEQTEDILRLGGVSSEEKIGGPIGLSVAKRLPWLVINLLTAFLAAFTISMFENIIVQVAALASAMTIISGMGGNAGTQTLSLVIRSITLGELDLKTGWPIVFKEVALGIINGAVVGVITGIVMYFRYGNFYLGLIIFLAMIGNLVIAGLFGFLIPLIIKRIGADPALASTIFLTTATDVCGFFIFLGLASLFLPLLV